MGLKNCPLYLSVALGASLGKACSVEEEVGHGGRGVGSGRRPRVVGRLRISSRRGRGLGP